MALFKKKESIKVEEIATPTIETNKESKQAIGMEIDMKGIFEELKQRGIYGAEITQKPVEAEMCNILWGIYIELKLLNEKVK